MIKKIVVSSSSEKNLKEKILKSTPKRSDTPTSRRKNSLERKNSYKRLKTPKSNDRKSTNTTVNSEKSKSTKPRTSAKQKNPSVETTDKPKTEKPISKRIVQENHAALNQKPIPTSTTSPNESKPDVKIAVSSTVFGQLDQMRKLTGKQAMLENTIESIEEEVKKQREEIAGLTNTLQETIAENTQKKIDQNRLMERFNNLKAQFDSQSGKLNEVQLQQHENTTSNDGLLRENKVLSDKLKRMDNKIQELNVEIQDGYKVNKKLEKCNAEYLEKNERLTKENELLKKSKAQKEKQISILLKEKNEKNNSNIKMSAGKDSDLRVKDLDQSEDKSHEKRKGYSDENRNTIVSVEKAQIKNISNVNTANNKQIEPTTHKYNNNENIQDKQDKTDRTHTERTPRDNKENDKNFTFSPLSKNKEKKGSDTIRKSQEEFKSLRDLNNDVSFKQRIKQLLNNDHMSDKYNKQWNNLNK